MQLVNAVWEFRSLGLRTVEITLEKGDPPPSAPATAGFQHIVVKVPITEIAVIHALEADGFQLAESQFTVSRSTQGRICDDATERFANQITASSADDNPSREAIFAAIRGGLFNTDRIYLDPKLGPELSAARYQNWVSQMLATPESTHVHVLRLLKSGIPVGFTSLRAEDGHVAHIVLAGIFSEYHDRGLGAAMIYWSIQLARGLGKSIARTSISASNLRMFGLYSHFGFNFDACHAVFRRIVL